MQITNNKNHVYNLLALIESILKYTKLHIELFGHHNGGLMKQPTEEVFNKTNGVFADFLKDNGLEKLIPLIEITHTIWGYGYVDEIGIRAKIRHFSF